MTQADAHVVILAGGQGTRFWPMSRRQRPKQFLSLTGNGESLIQATARRVEPLHQKSRLWIVTTMAQAPLVREALPYARVLVEPCARDTAASIAYAAMCIGAENPATASNPVMVVLPADHAVSDDLALCRTIEHAVAVAYEQDVIVTIGIPPASPHTGYGYIRRGTQISDDVYQISRFFEKPSEERAKQYLESGEYLWNSGMFAWRLDTINAAIGKFLPAIDVGLRAIQRAPKDERDAVAALIFAGLDPISVDFGILEHAQNCLVVEAENFVWNDVGSWDAWAALFSTDANENLVRGETVLLDTTRCVVHSERRLTAVIGVENLVIVDTDDALLICPRGRVQEVRQVVKELERRGREDVL